MIASTQTNSPLIGQTEGSAHPARQFDLATARMKSAGMRVTQPRMAILAALCRHDQPATIEQLHAEVGPESCDLVTVYRGIAAFEKIGLVERAFFHNGTALYKISLGQSARYHVVCKSTNQLQELDQETSAELRRALDRVQEKLRAQGYEEISHLVEFFAESPAAKRTAPVGVPTEN